MTRFAAHRPRWFRRFIVRRSTLLAAIVALCAAGSTPDAASAATYYWNTASALFSTPGDWTDSSTGIGGTTGTVPGAADIGQFNGTGINGAETITITTGTTQSVGGLIFNNTAATTLDSTTTTAATLAVGTSGLTINSGAGAVTLGNSTQALNISLLGSESWTNNATNSASILTVLNGVSLDSTVTTATTLTLAGTSTGTNVISGNITNGGSSGATLGLNVTGGLWTLSGTNTYGGTTTIASGATLTANSAASLSTSSAVTVNGGGTLGLLNTAAGNVTFGGSISGAGRILLTLNSGSNGDTKFNDLSAFTGTLEITAPSSISNKWDGTGNINSAATVKIDNLGQWFVSTGATYANPIQVVGVGNSENRGAIRLSSGTLSGSVSLLGNTTIGPENGTFSASSTISSGVSGTNTLTIGTSNSHSNLTISGNISNGSGTTALTISNATQVTLSGTNSYTGATTIGSGTLVVNNAAAIAAGSSINFTGGTLQYTTLNAADFSNQIASSTSAIALNTNGQTVTYSSALANSNSAGLTLNDTNATKGVLILSGANAYTGTTTITAGKIRLSGAGTLGATSNALADNATLDLNGVNATVGNLSGSGAVVNDNNTSATLTIGGGNGTGGTFSGALKNNDNSNATTGTLSVIKTGTGAISLSGTNAYTGTTSVNGGILEFVNEASLYSNNTVGGGWTAANITVASGGTLALGVGTGQFNATDVQTISGLGTLTAGFMSGSAIGLDTAGGSFPYSNPIANPNGGANILGLTKLGANTLTLSAANTYTGPTTIAAGVLALNNAGALGGGGSVIFTGGALQYTANNNADYSANFASSSSAITIDTNSRTVTYTSAIASTNTGGLTLNDTNATKGVLILSGANAYTGTTTVTAGTLRLSGSGTLGATSNSLAVASTLDLNGVNVSVGNFSGAGNVVNDNNTNATLTIGAGNNGGTFSGILKDNDNGNSTTGTLALLKAGTNDIAFTGANTYTGGTTIGVNAGRLQLSSATATYGTGPVNVASGGEAFFGAAATANNVFNIAGDGGGAGTNDTQPRGAIRIDSGTISNLGAVVLTADASIGTYGGGTGTINAVISQSGGTRNLTINKSTSGGVPGTIQFGAVNTYGGTTTLNIGTVKLGIANALPSTTQFIFGGSSTLNLNSLADSIQGVTVASGVTGTLSGGTLTTTSTTGSIVFTGSATNTLTGGIIALPSSGAVIDASAMTGGNPTLVSQLSGSGGVTIKALGDTSDTGNGSGTYLAINNTSNLSTLTGTITIASGLVYPGPVGAAGSDSNLGAASNPVSMTGGGFVFPFSTYTSPSTRLISLAGTGDRIFRVYGSNTATINGVISGVSTANLRKTDGGTLVLGAANTYAGNTLIGNGILQVGIANALPSTTQVIFSSSSTLNMNSLAETINGVTVNGGVTGTITNSTTTTGLVTTTSTTGSIVFTGASSNTLTGGVIALPAGAVIDSSAETAGVVATLTSQLSGAGAVTIKANGDTSDTGGGSGSALILNNTNNATTLTGLLTIAAGLVNPNGNDANLGQAGNTITVSGGGFYFNGANTLPNGRGIALSGTGNRIFRASNGNTTTINGIVSGTATLAKTDAGTLILTGTNTYTGGTYVGNGIARLSGTGSFGLQTTSTTNTGTLTVNSGGTLDLGGNSQGFGNFTGTGGVVVDDSNTSATLTIGNGNGTGGVFTGVLKNNDNGTSTGVLSLVKVGTGVIELDGVNTLTGNVNINAGTLFNTPGSSTANAMGTGSIIIGDIGGNLDATFKVSNLGRTYANPIVAAAGSTGNTLSIQTSGAAQTFTFTGGITLNNNLSLKTSGPDSGNVSDAITVSTGAVSGSGNLTTNVGSVGGASGGSITVSSSITTTGQIFNIGAGTNPAIISGQISASVTGINQNSATSALNLTANDSAMTAPIAITAGTLTSNYTVGNLVNPLGTGALTISPGATLNMSEQGHTDSFANAISVSNVTTGTATLANNSGLLTMSGDINFTGGSSTPTLQINNTNGGGGSYFTFSGSVAGSGNIALTGSGAGSPINLTGASVNNTGTITNTGTTAAGVVTISGAIGPNVTGVVQNSSAAPMILSGANTYTSSTTVSAGLLQLSGAGTLGAGAASLTLNAGTVDLNGTSQSVGAFSGAAGTTILNNGAGAQTLTIGAGGGAGTFVGTIVDHTAGTGTLALLKAGGGAVTLSGANTFSGITTISGGTLQLGDGTTSNGSVTSNITNNAALVVANPNAQTYFGAVSGSGTFTKTGAGALTLMAAQTYAGATTIQNGTLRLGAPAQPTVSGLQYQLDASKATNLTLVSGSLVSAWNDSTGNGNNFTQATTANQPTYTASGINGLGSVVFNGTSTKLVQAQASTTQTVFIIDKVNGNAGLDGIWGNNNNDFGVRLASTTAWQNGGTGSGNSNDYTFGGSMYVNGVLQAGNGSFTGGQAHLLEAVGASASSITAGLGEYWNNSARWFNGSVGEVLVFNGVLSTSDRQAVETYLTDKWLVPSVASNVLPTASAVSLTNSRAGLDISLLSGQTVGSLSGVAGSTVTLGAATLTVGGDNSSTEFAGTIGGTGGSLVKNGSGVFTLSGANTFTGGVKLSSTGTLRVNNGVTTSLSNSATGSGTVTLNGGVLSAGALGGSIAGLVVGGTTSGHTIAPSSGLSAGTFATLNLNGGLTTSNLTSFAFNLGTTVSGSGLNGFGIYSGDLINVNGAGLTITNANTPLTFGTNPSTTGDYRLFGGSFGSPNTGNLMLPTAPGTATYSLSTTVDPGFLDLVVTNNSSLLTLPGTTLTGVNMHVNVSGTPGSTTVMNGGTPDGHFTANSTGSNGLSFSYPSGTDVAAGGMTNFNVGWSTLSTAGPQSGQITIANSDNLSDTGGQKTQAVSGALYNLAAANSIGTINLGAVHAGASLSQAITLMNNAPVDATYTETLISGGFSSTTSGFTATGMVTTPLVAGGASDSSNLIVGAGVTLAANHQIGTTTLGLTSNAVNGSALGATNLTGQTVTIVADVFSGKQQWTLATGGAWATNGNWSDTMSTAAAGSPGISGFSGDTATFGTSIGSTPATINLNTSSPVLAGITFNNASAGYTIAGTNRLTLDTTGSGPAAITITAGNHTISAPVTVTGGVTVSGAGSVTLTGANNNFTGPILVGNTMSPDTAKLVINAASASTVDSSVTATIASGATLELDGTASALTDSMNATHRASVQNDGSLVVAGGTTMTQATQQVGGIDGAGSVTVADYSSLTADHINQTSLVIGNGSVFTLAPSDSNGNPMVQGSGSSLVLAGSLAPSSSFIASSGSLVGVGSTSSAPSVSLGGIGGASVAAVPEPSAIVLMLFGALMALPVVRRRRKHDR